MESESCPFDCELGVSYNRSIMRIARIDSDVAMHEFIRQSESHLLEVTRTYWALYAARVTYLQKARLVDETARVSDELKARQKVDARQSQLFRAESALASRRDPQSLAIRLLRVS